MTAVEAAAKWGLARSYVVKLCANGRIPNVCKVRSRSGRLMYDIPTDAQRPVLPRGRHAVTKLAALAPRDIVDRVHKMPKLNGRSPARYIWEHQSKYTIGELAAKLGISNSEVVRLFDQSFATFQGAQGGRTYG